MTRIMVAGPRTLERQVVDALYEARAVHVKDYTPPEGETVFKLGSPMEGGERASGLLIKLRSFKAALGLENAPAPDERPKPSDVLPKVEAMVVALEMSITSAADEKAKLEAEAAELRARLEELKPFEGLAVPLSLLTGYGALAVFTGFVSSEAAGKLRAAVKELDIVENRDPDGAVAIFVDRDSREAAMKVLLDAGFQEARVPTGEGTASEERLAAAAALSKTIEPRLESKKEELEALSKKHAPFILAAAELLEMEVERCETPLRAAHSPNAFVLEGFVPSKRIGEVRTALENATGGRVHIETEQIPQLVPPAPHGHGKPEDNGHGEHGDGEQAHHGVGAASQADVPVALSNPKITGAFEYLTNLISLPKYGEIDPTVLMFFVFPVFFGIMLGDIGYGIAVLILGHLAARTKSTDLVAVGRLLRMGGLMSFLFGFVFGEFFGFEVFGSGPGPIKFWAHDIFVPGLVGVLGFDGYFPISRLHSVPFLLTVTIWVGIVHIFVGMLLGFRNQLRQAGFAHAMYAKGSWIIILVSGVLWVRTMTGAMFGGGDLGAVPNDTGFLVGLAVFMVGVVLLLKGEGGVGAVELPSLLGNILSYSRLLAIGLSGVAIALTANLPIEWAMEAGGGAWAVAIPLAVLGHLLGIFLGMLGPGLHALRLHYVEFFTKFYQGGGRAFAPLGKETKYTAP